MSVLNGIVERTRSEVAARTNASYLRDLRRTIEVAEPSFARALSGPGLALIAEFKPRSPSKGEIRPGATIADVARVYAPYASALSILCDTVDFGGGPHLLKEAATLSPLPLLYKGFVVSQTQVLEARAAGAHAVLLMASVLDDAALRDLYDLVTELGMSALVEVHSDAELGRALRVEPEVIGVNRRDLHTLQFDTDRMFALLRRIPEGVVRVAESGFCGRADIEEVTGKADAVLIGSAFMGAPNMEDAIQEMGWRRR